MFHTPRFFSNLCVFLLRLPKSMKKIVDSVTSNVRTGQVWLNPGGGTSKIKRSDEEMLSYVRGHSRMYLPMSVLVEAVARWRGKQVTSTDLRSWRPDVFDSSRGGHSSNTTFLFMTLHKAGYASEIQGAGKAGSPFWVEIFEEPGTASG